MSEFIITVLQILLCTLFTIGIIGLVIGIGFPEFYSKHFERDNQDIDIHINIYYKDITKEKSVKNEQLKKKEQAIKK